MPQHVGASLFAVHIWPRVCMCFHSSIYGYSVISGLSERIKEHLHLLKNMEHGKQLARIY